ncbi:MAG: hypothetical protein IKN87_00630 [Bacilli bacterium]|nr:hypothetical protein [Bacilli bacterium]
MKSKYNTYKDFNNVSLKVNIDKKIYYGSLNTNNNHITLSINMSKDIEHWRKINANRDTICGSIVVENIDITLINCTYCGSPYTMFKNEPQKNIYEAEFIIDRILLGKKVSKIDRKLFSKANVIYDNIDSFTNDQPYELDTTTMTYKVTPSNYKINTNESDINICFSCKNRNGQKLLSVERETIVDFTFKKNLSLSNTLNEIYKFRCFLIILLRKHITVSRQIISIDNSEYQLIDCRIDKVYPIDEELFAHKMVKIEKITNISEVYQEFQNQYLQLLPALDVYYNTISCFIPNINRFILGTTALEYFSNEYDFVNALSLTKQKKPKAKEPDYVDKVEHLIANINVILKCNISDIPIIADNVKEARVYYIHYNKKRKQLSDEEQQYYSYFVFDILLLNIYKLIKIDLSLMESSCHNNIYYEINNLL